LADSTTLSTLNVAFTLLSLMFSISLIGRYPYPDEVYELQKYDNEKNHETSHIDD